MPEPTVMVTAYTVSCFPPDDLDGSSWDIRVEYCGRDRWAVRWLGQMCADSKGHFVHEPQPSSRSDYFLKRHRFSLEKALLIAKAAAPGIILNNMTPADAIAWRLAHKSGD
jgi:hypothetical protein